MRVSTAFNKMLSIPGAWVCSVTFAPGEVVVGLRRRFKRLTCRCGHQTSAVFDRSTRKWRHLDLGGVRLYLQAEIRRLCCPRCGVRTEIVPWARAKARHTRDFEDVVAWLAQRTDRTAVSRLMRCSWEAVTAMVGRVVFEHLDGRRLQGIYRIGVDEISYRRHHFLTLVADHDRGGVVWAGEGRRSQTLAAFYDELGERGRAELQAVSLDLGKAYMQATRDAVPHASICIDPFHVVALANKAVDAVRKQMRRQTGYGSRSGGAATRHLRWALLKGRSELSSSQQAALLELRKQRHVLWRSWELKEELRDVYRLREPTDARAYLDAWLHRASRSRIAPIVTLARTIRDHLEGIISAVELGLSNSRLEGLNSKIRLINHRGYGHHSAAALTSMIYLCCGGITVNLPFA